MVLITFVSVMGLAVEHLISGPLPAELGGASPFAHILIMGGASMTALYLLRHIRADLDGRAPGHGFLGRAADMALGLGIHAASGGAGKAVLGGARGLGKRLGGGGTTPWERLDEQAAANPHHVLGPPQDGFAPVPTESHNTPDQPGEAPATADGPAAGGRERPPRPTRRRAGLIRSPAPPKRPPGRHARRAAANTGAAGPPPCRPARPGIQSSTPIPCPSRAQQQPKCNRSAAAPHAGHLKVGRARRR